MELERAREDLLVAATGGGATVALAVASSVVEGVRVGTIPALAPIAVYLAYLFSRKGGPYGPWDTAPNWALVAAGVGVVTLVVGALGFP
ncbi:MAG: hypothetical protein PPP55_12255 [Halorubrum sp.]